jgi:CheY-like chemotaxis protein
MGKTTKRILYAEDHAGDRAPVTAFLQAKGLDVVEVTDPSQAMEALSEGDFDLVVLDLIMPEGDPEGGERVLQYMVDHGKETIPVILATAYGYNGPAARAKTKFSGIVKDVITKTFDPPELYARIMLFLGGQAPPSKDPRRDSRATQPD